jgi:hypothetical protein
VYRNKSEEELCAIAIGIIAKVVACKREDIHCHEPLSADLVYTIFKLLSILRMPTLLQPTLAINLLIFIFTSITTAFRTYLSRSIDCTVERKDNFTLIYLHFMDVHDLFDTLPGLSTR